MQGFKVHLLVMTVVGVLFAACGSEQNNYEAYQMEIDASTLEDLGSAPEIHNQIWINSEQPLQLADLRGKVVLLEMWTFG